MFRKIAIAMLATGVLATSAGASQAATTLPAMPVAAAAGEAEMNGRWHGNFYVYVDYRGKGYGRGHGYGRGYDRGHGQGYGRGYSQAHYRWCAAKYRSYDPRSNTYQPYEGPRRQCWSPYS